jgi:peptide-methionine (R)-S-oxide reductase
MKSIAIRFLLLCLFVVCGIPMAKANDAEATRIRAKVKAIPMTEKVQLTDNEWRKILTPAQFQVLREAGTEPPFTNEYANNHERGIYVCAACRNELFDSKTKFESGTGWPSFYAPLAKDKIVVLADNTGGMRRQEVRSARCGSHLGHAFNDGPAPTHLRYCLNSVSLKLKTTKNQ